MRAESVERAKTEVQVLDALSDVLRRRIEETSKALRAGRSDIATGDTDYVASLLHIREGLRESFEELARRGYGRVIILNEIDESGNCMRTEVFRVSQANAEFADAGIRILPRNSSNASNLVTCRVGEEIEFTTPNGERYFEVIGLIDVEGMTPLLRGKPTIELARFFAVQDPVIDIIRDLRTFVETTEITAPQGLLEPTHQRDAAEPEPEGYIESFWPTRWESMILGNEEAASLGSHFFTRTTGEQEVAIRAIRGVTVVEGIAGTGKTSVALGRLKFFANFRSGEHLSEHGLNPNDWTDFDPSDMVGFVLNPSLVQYLKQTAERLELGKMKIQDFDEYREQERQSRRLFARPFQRSSERNPAAHRTVGWLMMLDSVLSEWCADSLGKVLNEPLPKPDTPDGKSVTDARWQELLGQLWEKGPLRARVTGLIRRMGGGAHGIRSGFRIQGVLANLDRDARLSDRELEGVASNERRAVREAVENVSQRFFRVFNPTELLLAAYSQLAISESRFGLTADALGAAENIRKRLSDNKVTDDDVVTALCLNALACDRFERDISNIPYLRDFAERVAVFIDEYQDFSEQQVLLMAFRARPKYRHVTIAGDPSQRLHRDGLSDIATALPFASGSIRSIFLDVNHRQTKPLEVFSNCIRKLTERIPIAGVTAAQAPLTVFQEKKEFVEFAIQRISKLPEEATVAIICPDIDKAGSWHHLMKDGLDGYFRNPVLSERARLTERFKTHFTTSLDAKGLEFDVVVVPDISEFSEDDPIEINALYVAVSRPRYALMVGCLEERSQSVTIRQLIESGHLCIDPIN